MSERSRGCSTLTQAIEVGGPNSLGLLDTKNMPTNPGPEVRVNYLTC